MLESFNLFLFIIFSLLLSLMIDLIFGELPTKIHPVVIIGSIIDFSKRIFISFRNKLSGLLTTLLTCVISSVLLLIILYISSFNEIVYFIVFSIVLSSTFSIKMLISTAKSVEDDLLEDITKARKAVSYLVSRNTEELTEGFIVSATIESMSENITDSYVAPIFYLTLISIVLMILNINCYFVILLVPFIYRISNTLDAMLGYKSDDLIYIGYFPAKLDDILNYIPSRIAGLFVVISAFILKFNWKNSYYIMRRDARNCPSPNSGFTMASTAGALDIQLIKKHTYILGDNTDEINVNDISKAISLTKLTILLYTIFIFLILLIVKMII